MHTASAVFRLNVSPLIVIPPLCFLCTPLRRYLDITFFNCEAFSFRSFLCTPLRRYLDWISSTTVPDGRTVSYAHRFGGIQTVIGNDSIKGTAVSYAHRFGGIQTVLLTQCNPFQIAFLMHTASAVFRQDTLRYPRQSFQFLMHTASAVFRRLTECINFRLITKFLMHTASAVFRLNLIVCQPSSIPCFLCTPLRRYLDEKLLVYHISSLVSTKNQRTS